MPRGVYPHNSIAAVLRWQDPEYRARRAAARLPLSHSTEWLEARIEPEPMSGCWIWIGVWNPGGYGRIAVQVGRPGRYLLAHRVMYERMRGPIPEGLELDHLCRNRACVNPAHLEPVTRGENISRGRRARSEAWEQANEWYTESREGQWA